MSEKTSVDGNNVGPEPSPVRRFEKAIYARDAEMARNLLDAGLDPNSLTSASSGSTLLMDAALDGAGEILKLLIEWGADLEKRDNEGMSALDIVDYHLDEFGVADVLIRHGAVRNPELETRQDVLDGLYEAHAALQSIYFDDRTYVYEISRCISDSVLSTERVATWAVIARRNVHRYPPVRIDKFSSEELAVEFYRRIVPATPRVSLGHRTPDPVPSWEEYQVWLKESSLEGGTPHGREQSVVRDPRTLERKTCDTRKKRRFSPLSPKCLQERAIRAAVRRRMEKPRRGKRRKIMEPSQAMTRLVAAKPSDLRSTMVRHLRISRLSNQLGPKSIQGRKALPVASPRQVVSTFHLGLRRGHETRKALVNATMAPRKRTTNKFH